jgi:hypothetical protein
MVAQPQDVKSVCVHRHMHGNKGPVCRRPLCRQQRTLSGCVDASGQGARLACLVLLSKLRTTPRRSSDTCAAAHASLVSD